MCPSAVRTVVVLSIFIDELEQQVAKAKVSPRGARPPVGGCVAISVGDRRTSRHELEPFFACERDGARGLALANYSCELRTPKLSTRERRTFFRRDGSRVSLTGWPMSGEKKS